MGGVEGGEERRDWKERREGRRGGEGEGEEPVDLNHLFKVN
jgi:hypothetical protein